VLISDILLADKSDSQPNKAGCVIDACLQCSANDVLIDVGGFYYRKYGMLLPNPTHGHQVTAGESGTRMADEQHGMSNVNSL